MSRTRRMTTAAAAALAAVLGVGVMTAPVGATTALWQDQVTIPGVTIVAGPTSDTPPIEVVDPNKYPDRVYFPSGSQKEFEYTLKVDLSQFPLPVVLELGHGWGAMEKEGSPSINGGMGNVYWVPVFDDGGEVVEERVHDFSQPLAEIPGGTSQTRHYFHPAGPDEPKDKNNEYPPTAVPAGVTEILVTFHFQVNNYYSDTRFEMSDGRGYAALYVPGDDFNTVGEELFRMEYKLPNLCNGGAGVEDCDPPVSTPSPTPEPTAEQSADQSAAQLPSAPAAGEPTPDVSQPEDCQATTTPVPDPTSSPDPTSDDVATTRDEDLEASP